MKKTRQAATDFTAAQLPHSRKEVFFDCIKQRWRLLVCLGLLLLLFALPTLAADCVADVYGMIAANRFQSGELSEKEAFAAVVVTTKIAKLCHIVTYSLLGLGLSGITRIVRQLVWNEGVLFKSDFVTGVKQNAPFYCSVGALCGAIDFCCYVVRMSKMHVVWRVIPQVVSLALLLPAAAIALILATVYADGVGKTVKNGFLLYFKTAPMTLLALLLVFSPCFLTFVSNIILKYLLLIVVVTFVCPLCIMGWQLYCYGIFDKYINVYNYPEILNKGFETEV